jgi:predicted RNA methylase
MRLMGQCRLGYYPAPPEAVEGILKHLRMPDAANDRVRILDPCCGEALAIHQIATNLAVPMSHVYAVELDAGRADRARENLPGATVLGPASFLGTSITGGFFSLAYVNPPFDSELGGNRREEQSFVERATRLLLPKGMLVLICPTTALAHNTAFQEFLDCHYEDAALYRFPDEHRQFRELVYFGTKRKTDVPRHQGHLRSLSLYSAYRPEDPVVGTEPRTWTLPVAPGPSRFQKAEYTEPELIEAVERSPLARRLEPPAPPPPKTPPLPLHKGHVALLLASGMLDGLIEPEDGNVHVVRGTARKVGYLSEKSRTEDPDSGAVTEKEVWSQKIVLTVRAVGPDGDIRTFEDGSAESTTSSAREGAE